MLVYKFYVSIGREGETCTLRGHTAPLQTATATTYGPTSLKLFWSRRWILPPHSHGPEPCALLFLPLLVNLIFIRSPYSKRHSYTNNDRMIYHSFISKMAGQTHTRIKTYLGWYLGVEPKPSGSQPDMHCRYTNTTIIFCQCATITPYQLIVPLRWQSSIRDEPIFSSVNPARLTYLLRQITLVRIWTSSPGLFLMYNILHLISFYVS